MKDGIIEFITAFMLLVIAIGIFALSVKWKASKSEKEFMTEISSYEIISIEDKNYNTNEVVTVIYHIRDITEMHMKLCLRTVQRFISLRIAIP